MAPLAVEIVTVRVSVAAIAGGWDVGQPASDGEPAAEAAGAPEGEAWRSGCVGAVVAVGPDEQAASVSARARVPASRWSRMSWVCSSLGGSCAGPAGSVGAAREPRS